MVSCAALVVAAGRGHRAGGGLPKQYRALAGQPVLRRTLAAFAGHPAVDAVRPVIHPDDRALFDAAARDLDVLEPVAGGETRQDSVRLGLESLAELAPERVLIHDAARPFVDGATVDRVLAALGATPGAVPAVPVADTLKRADGGRVAETVPRQDLWRAQTPQGFRFADILAAHRRCEGRALTDDAAVAEHVGLAVAIVEGTDDNVKLTSEDDFRRAEANLALAEWRTGFGFDAHAFEAGDHLMLCGVRVPFERGLAGHSDADVGLHALTDALLGAIGAGDIGVHFPPSDARWRDAGSDLFLAEAARLVAALGGSVSHVDVTLICEAPRIGPHRDAMIARIAEILGIAATRVSVKATTTEGLGFTGRGEGIGAQAVATVRLPAGGGE
jgi:2-C-methyl-D-erythritol 4-phosphate cytidylyltransferase/2-C-methyl-D-erythritol 2,4-cyclodiphosphate synthase